MSFRRNRLLIAIIFLIFVNFVASTLMSVWAMYDTVQKNEIKTTESVARNVYDAIQTELQKPVMVGKAVVSTETLINLMEHEEEYTLEEMEETFKHYLISYKDYFEYSTVSIISDKTHRYYTQLGFNKVIDPENDEHDIWYKLFLEQNREYSFDIDVDQANGNKWTLFMNIRIQDEAGNLLGVTGLGVDMTYIQEMIADIEKEYGIQVSFVDTDGNVQLGSDDANVTSRILNTYKDKTEDQSFHSELTGDKCVVTRVIDDLGWNMVVENESNVRSLTWSIVRNNLIVMGILLFVVLIVAAYLISHSQGRLIKKSEQAIQASAAKGKFLANMSHEIRTPINAVLGLDTMILRESSETHIKQYAADIESAGQTLLALINDILDFSKIESGKMEIVPVEYEFSQLIHDVVNMVSMKAKNKNLRVELKLDEKLPSGLYGDDVRIRQILVNIMNNAVKYTQEGSVTLQITGEQKDGEALLHFAVIDTGIGIKEEDMDKLFADFERIEEDRNRNVEGTGLGMSITIQLLALMGSKLEVSSTYGKGSNFHFDLKQEIRNEAAIGNITDRLTNLAETYKYNVLFTAPSAKVLVVDDNSTNRMVFRSLLKQTKVQIDEADGARSSLEKIFANKYDVIFMDHMMPEMDGIQVMEELQRVAEHPNKDTPVVILTANAISGVREMYLAAGFNDYLSKPVIPEKLEKMLSELIPAQKIVYEKSEDSLNQVLVHEEESTADEFPIIEGIDWNYGLTHTGDVSSLREILQSFYERIDEDANNLEDMYERIKADTGDAEVIKLFQIKVHSIKSSANLIGIIPIGGMAAALEYASRDGNLELVLDVAPYFIDNFRRLKFSLEDFCKKEELVPVREIEDVDIIIDYVNHLSDATQEFESDIADEMLKKLKEFIFPEEIKSIFDKILSAMDNFDIEEVEPLCSEMVDVH